MRLAVDGRAAPQVRAIIFLKLNELKYWLSQEVNVKRVKDESQRAHYSYALSQIDLFLKNPEKVKLAIPLSPPPGAPIGMYD